MNGPSPTLRAVQMQDQNFTELRRGSSLVMSAGDHTGDREMGHQTTGNNRRERSGSFTAF